MPQVSVIDTSWGSPQQFANDVVAALMRQGLSQQSAMILCAHIALSTGWGKKCHNWNLAGIKATESQNYVVLTGFEYEGGSNVYSSMKWRAFNSLDEGVAAVIGLLQASRYAPAWALLQAGDTEYFAEVGRNGWYTAPPESTAAEMRGRLTQIKKWLADGISTDSDNLGMLAVAVGVGYLIYRWWKKR